MEYELILKAAHFAAEKHRDQRRKGSESSPYINHPISVALIMSKIGGVDDPEILSAALLHDTIEDTNTTPEELEAEFGSKIRSLVEEVTDYKSLPKVERKKGQIEHASKLSTEAAFIKLGDKICNVRDVTYSPPSHWDIDRRKKYFDWAEEVIKNCPNVNPSLKKHFDKTLVEGRKVLLSQ